MSNNMIDDPTNILGISYLINTTGAQSGFDFHELEEQITGSQKPKQNIAESFENELVGLYDEQPVVNTNIDNILNSINETSITQTVAAPQQKFEFPSDPNLAFMTNEQKRQNIIGDVFNDINEEYGNQPSFSIEKEKEEDEKSRKLEGIESLREILEDEGENLSRIPNVTITNSMEEIDNVYKMLNLKNDRKRCCTFAEEGILLAAHGVEHFFDGKKSYLGRKPDMTDWHKSVQTKLRRMRHDTSNVVSQVIQRAGLGSLTRILLEIFPSMILYSKMRKSQNKDNLIISDDEYNNAINKLNDH